MGPTVFSVQSNESEYTLRNNNVQSIAMRNISFNDFFTKHSPYSSLFYTHIHIF